MADDSPTAAPTLEGVERLKRLDALTAGIPDAELERVIRSGRAMVKLGRIAEAIRRAGGQPAEGDRQDDELEPDLEAVRGSLAKDLTYAVLVEGEYEELDVMERAKAIRDLSEAYVRLGGELAIPPALPRPRLNPADVELREKVRGAAWRAANEAGAEAKTADAIAAAVEAELREAAR